MGLTLRRLEEEGKPVEDLRAKIYRKHEAKGLHVAQFVQNGLFGKYLNNILPRIQNPKKLVGEIDKFFKNLDHYTLFVRKIDDPQKKTAEVLSKIHAHSPKVFILSSMQIIAMDTCEQIKKGVMSKLSGYTVESYKSEEKLNYLISKVETPPNIDKS